MLRAVCRIVLLVLFAWLPLDGSLVSVKAQQHTIPRQPLEIVDGSTGQVVPELLLLPRYSSFKGTSTLLGEGPGVGTNGNYLAKPFIYRASTPFKLKLPKSAGIGLPGLLFIGKGRSIEGVLVVAPGYRPVWFTNLWSVDPERKLQLTPITEREWSKLLTTDFDQLAEGVLRIESDCSFWDMPSPCSLEIHYNKNERKLVRDFLKQPRRDVR